MLLRMPLEWKKQRLLILNKFLFILLLFFAGTAFAVEDVHLEWDKSTDIDPLYYRMQYNSPMHDHLLLNQTGTRYNSTVWQENASIRYTDISMGVIDSVVMHPFCKHGYGCLKGYKVYYDTDGSGSPYSGTGLDQGDSPVHVGCNLGITFTGFEELTTYYFAVTAYTNNEYDNLLESTYSNEVDWTSASQCGNGVCGTGECISGCTDDCSVEDCCGIEGCNVAIGETVGNCPGDCSEDPPPVESGAPNLSSIGYEGVSIN